MTFLAVLFHPRNAIAEFIGPRYESNSQSREVSKNCVSQKEKKTHYATFTYLPGHPPPLSNWFGFGMVISPRDECRLMPNFVLVGLGFHTPISFNFNIFHGLIADAFRIMHAAPCYGYMLRENFVNGKTAIRFCQTPFNITFIF